MNTQKGRLITLEGGDGVGKTTHIELLETYLTEQGVSVLTTREPGGTALAVEDAEMVDAMYEMASTEGIIACPEGAATLVGLKHLLEQGFLQPDETIVLLNTGSGYKYLDLIKESAQG